LYDVIVFYLHMKLNRC